jgi:hypothetical protein
MAQSKTLTVSIHRRAWAVMTEEQKDTYRKLLTSRHIKTAGDLK